MWLAVFVISIVLLAVVLIRGKMNVRWFGYMALNIVLAAFILYFINASGWFADFHLPINVPTVLTVGILGLPGLLLLIALKLMLF